VKRAYLIAAGITLALVAWLGSGQIQRLRSDAPAQPSATTPPPGSVPAGASTMQVRVRESVAAQVVREVLLNGRTAPARRVELRAEVTGRVVDLPVERGSFVGQGQTIARLDPRDRDAWLRQAKAALAQAEAEYEAGRKLREKDFMAETELAAKLAALENARAGVERAELDRRHTQITAPFAGILDKRPVEIGELVEVGDPVGTVLEQDPLLVVGDLAEVDLRGVRAGMQGSAELVTGETAEGRIRYVASEADAATRTFRVELEVPNPGSRLPAGTSAVIRIPLDPVNAHEVSSALLVLNDEGMLGVQSVDEGGAVRFHTARIVRSGPTSVWLADLPPSLRLITVGQGFVRQGQKVTAVPEPATAAGAAGGNGPAT
jgi:multidrug efflux system membrane fusion protein